MAPSESVFVSLADVRSDAAAAVWPLRTDLFVDGVFGEAGSVAGPCPDIAVPAANRPQVLRLDSRHASVREVQRKLNALHQYRIDNHESGLPHAPLVADCIYGSKTRDAVKAFQAIAFPGNTKEHDGKVGGKTWQQLDLIAVGVDGAAEVTVAEMRFIDTVGRVIDWNHIIGLHSTAIGIELLASGIPAAAMPLEVVVQLAGRPANLLASTGSSSGPITFVLAKAGADVLNPARIAYRISRPFADLAAIHSAGKSSSVATVGRRGASSDTIFRNTLGGEHRGSSTQPLNAADRTADEKAEIPDAFDLFRAGGVQVLELSLTPHRHWRNPVPARRLCRSSAKFFYYSGHGLSSSGKLAVDTQDKACGQTGSYQDWLGPSEILSTWAAGLSPDVLIIAGCSMLKINLGEHIAFRKPLVGPATEWMKLLSSRGGTLTSLLGYGAKAPCDAPNGDKIAAVFARRLTSGSTDIVRDWLAVNGDHNANNAAAIDARGYWWIEPELLGGYKIRGPLKLP